MSLASLSLSNYHTNNYVRELVLSTRGNSFYALTPRPAMPRIDDILLDSVVYLYPSADEAKEGVSYGGSGFLVLIESEEEPWDGYAYAVTNKHVIEGGCSVVRVSRLDGETEAIPLAQSQWVPHPTEDLSAALIDGLSPLQHRVTLIPDEMLLTKAACSDLKIGAGDDVYMVGRFIKHDGRQRNQPFVQSGIISLMPTDVVVEWDENKTPTKTEELFLVEMRSLSGCSGSPVFFQFPLTASTSPRLTPENKELIRLRWLLGIDCAHFTIDEKVVELVGRGVRKEREKTPYVTESNAGQMMVVPAWKLRELLDDPRFETDRRQKEQARAERKANSHIVRDSEKGQGDESD